MTCRSRHSRACEAALSLEGIDANTAQANAKHIVPQLTPLLLGIRDAANYVGVGRSTIYQTVKDGELTLIKIRGRSLLRVSELNDWVNRRLAQP